MKIKKILYCTLCLIVSISILLTGCSSIGTSQPETTARTKTEQELGAQEIIRTLESILNNPSSLYIYSIYYASMDDFRKALIEKGYNQDNIDLLVPKYDYIYEIDCSAENVYGGTTRTKYYVSYIVGESISTNQFDTTSKGDYQEKKNIAWMSSGVGVWEPIPWDAYAH